jgi:hypothetical protein
MSSPETSIFVPTRAVTCYESADGTLFRDPSEAVARDISLDFREWYENNKLYGRYAGSSVEFREIADWLSNNRSVLRAIMKSDRQLDDLESLP